MNSIWLTTLKSKSEEVRKKFEKELEARGIKWSAQDIVALFEDLTPQMGQRYLSGVLNFFRPMTQGMGLRISHLSNDHIELVLPYQEHNLEEVDQYHPGSILTASYEAVKMLWLRHAPIEGFKILLLSTHIENYLQKNAVYEVSKSSVSKTEVGAETGGVSGDLRVKYQLSEVERESHLSELRRFGRTQVDCTCSIYDHQEKMVSQIQMKILIHYTPQMEGG